MARGNGNGEAGIGHNSGTVHDAKERAALIQDACRRITNLTEERAGLSQDISDIKNEIVKGKLGMKISDFNAALRLYNLEGDARDDMLSTVQECFDALGVGGQLDWVQVAERAKSRVSDTDAPAAN
jgi:hypothetical protein